MPILDDCADKLDLWLSAGEYEEWLPFQTYTHTFVLTKTYIYLSNQKRDRWYVTMVLSEINIQVESVDTVESGVSCFSVVSITRHTKVNNFSLL